MDLKKLTQKEKTVLGIAVFAIIVVVVVVITSMSSPSKNNTTNTSDVVAEKPHKVKEEKIDMHIQSDLSDAFDKLRSYVASTDMLNINPNNTGATKGMKQRDLEMLKAFTSTKKFEIVPDTLGTDENYSGNTANFSFELKRQSDNQVVEVSGKFNVDSDQITELSFDKDLNEV
ncbi:hypothetical protein ABZZ08_002859 [Listeria monocytogenes]|jgi:hypothetical protein